MIFVYHLVTTCFVRDRLRWGGEVAAAITLAEEDDEDEDIAVAAPPPGPDEKTDEAEAAAAATGEFGCGPGLNIAGGGAESRGLGTTRLFMFL